MLSQAAVKRFYDRFGSRQDKQAFYEDAALDDLVAHAAFADTQAIVEFGCGTGRFAQRILGEAGKATYVGLDVSTTMVALARTRLTGLGDRAQIRQLAPGTVELPLDDQCADRVISTYVLDLLPDADIGVFFREARRVLRPDGRLCLVSLTRGPALLPRFVGNLWNLVFRLRPQLVGGCRPIELTPYCDGAVWEMLHHRTVVSWAIPSEILVARPA